MDINFTITYGIGTPGDIEHFILDGLNANPGGVTGNPWNYYRQLG